MAETTERNQLLTSLNTGSKEHIIKNELVSCPRNVERGGKNQSLSAIIYRRRTNFGHRNNWASPRGPAVKSKVLIIEGY